MVDRKLKLFDAQASCNDNIEVKKEHRDGRGIYDELTSLYCRVKKYTI